MCSVSVHNGIGLIYYLFPTSNMVLILVISQSLCKNTRIRWRVFFGLSQYDFTAWWKIRYDLMSCRYCYVFDDGSLCLQIFKLISWPDKFMQLRKCSEVSCWLTSNKVAKCTPVAQLSSTAFLLHANPSSTQVTRHQTWIHRSHDDDDHHSCRPNCYWISSKFCHFPWMLW